MAKEHGRGVQHSNLERQLRMKIRMNFPSLPSHCRNVYILPFSKEIPLKVHELAPFFPLYSPVRVYSHKVSEKLYTG